MLPPLATGEEAAVAAVVVVVVVVGVVEKSLFDASAEKSLLAINSRYEGLSVGFSLINLIA